MINIIIEDAKVRQCETRNAIGWVLMHPSNDAILAYCDTRDEAVSVREAINDLARQLRGIGHTVSP